MERPSRTLQRSLSYVESTLHHATVAMHSSTICVWAAGTGPLRIDDLRRAGQILHLRHPLLRARIAGPPGKYRFITDVPWDQIPVTDQALAEGEGINSFVEPLMNTPLSGHARTWELHVVRTMAAQRWWLIVRTHHAVTDGRAAFSLLDQLGQLLGQLTIGETPEINPQGLPDPIEHQLGPAGTMEQWKAAANAVANEIGAISFWAVDTEAATDQRRACNTFTIHDEKFSQRLLERCHTEGTTVQGALAAAVARGISDHLGQRINIDTITPVDLRRFAEIEIDPQEIACKIVCLDTGSTGVDTDGNPWDVARAYRQKLERQLDNRCNPPVDFSPEDLERAGERWRDREGRHTHGFSLTNTGNLAIQGDYGPIQFEEVDITATVRWGGFPVLLSAYTYRGKLRCCYTWTWPLLSRAHAQSLVEGVEKQLRTMVEIHPSAAFGDDPR